VNTKYSIIDIKKVLLKMYKNYIKNCVKNIHRLNYPCAGQLGLDKRVNE
jgi:hypothetical protein